MVASLGGDAMDASIQKEGGKGKRGRRELVCSNSTRRYDAQRGVFRAPVKRENLGKMDQKDAPSGNWCSAAEKRKEGDLSVHTAGGGKE